jgi:uncharacterized protein (DUF885 family)
MYTGQHALGWTRQQTTEFTAEDAGGADLKARNETDRHIVWPGRALPHKTGELEMRELGARAEKAQGEHFDLRSLHDVVLLDGAVPLDVLEEKVES